MARDTLLGFPTRPSFPLSQIYHFLSTVQKGRFHRNRPFLYVMEKILLKAALLRGGRALPRPGVVAESAGRRSAPAPRRCHRESGRVHPPEERSTHHRVMGPEGIQIVSRCMDPRTGNGAPSDGLGHGITPLPDSAPLLLRGVLLLPLPPGCRPCGRFTVWKKATSVPSRRRTRSVWWGGARR